MQASVWWGLLFSMAKRQLSLMSRLCPTAFQFADTLGTRIFRSSVKDGLQLSRMESSVEVEYQCQSRTKQLSSVF